MSTMLPATLPIAGVVANLQRAAADGCCPRITIGSGDAERPSSGFRERAWTGGDAVEGHGDATWNIDCAVAALHCNRAAEGQRIENAQRTAVEGNPVAECAEVACRVDGERAAFDHRRPVVSVDAGQCQRVRAAFDNRSGARNCAADDAGVSEVVAAIEDEGCIVDDVAGDASGCGVVAEL